MVLVLCISNFYIKTGYVTKVLIFLKQCGKQITEVRIKLK